jgi:hypothetical protein
MIKKMIMAATLAIASTANAGGLIMPAVTNGEDTRFDKQIYDIVYQSHYETIAKKYGKNMSVYASIIFAYDAQQKFCAMSMVSVVGTAVPGKSLKIDGELMPSSQSIRSATEISEYDCGRLLGKLIIENQRQLINIARDTYTKNTL